MKCSTICVWTALSALALGAARAESEAEYAMQPPGGPRGERVAEQPKPKPRPAPRSAMFAPAAAASAKRMPAEQREERRFLKEAAAGSRFEAEASRMALGKSGDASVRSFAAMLINHHASVNNELLHMLQGRGMAAPMLGNDQRKILNRLSRLQGAKFDRLYLEEVALKHQQDDVQFYEKASFAAADARLKAWINRQLPTLRYHLATAERIAPPDLRLARTPGAWAPAAGIHRFAAGAGMAARSMGAGRAPVAQTPSQSLQFGGSPSGDMEFGGSAQLGVNPPLAARANESNSR